jgi:hypothetical protein
MNKFGLFEQLWPTGHGQKSPKIRNNGTAHLDVVQTKAYRGQL